MNTGSHPDVTRVLPLNRRSFLTILGLGAASSAALAACSSEPPSGSGGPSGGGGDVTSALPNHIPIDYVTPDFPSVNGSTAGYATIPTDLVQVFDAPPGSGSEFTAMTPLWGAIPPTEGNQYFDAVNAAIGSTITFQISDGNTYGDKLAAVLASERDVPDWVSIPTWNIPPRFDQAVEALFEDLTPYLAGDAVEKYPNLANIPTDVWKFCVFDGQLKALPFPGEIITDAIFYRDDILEAEGITTQPTNGQELLDLAKELTGADRWGANDLWNSSVIIHGVVPKWRINDDGTLTHRVETDEYRAALEWNAALFAQGSVHPDAVADNSGDAKTRFESGLVLISNDGVGGWHEALSRQLASNPTYSQRPFTPFAAEGGTPVLWKGNPANIFSFIKKNEDKARIEELLAVADFLASPFGTTEYQLINFGLEDVHFTFDQNGLPVATELAATEVQPTYIFLTDPPVVNTKVQYPGFVEAFCTWMADAAGYVQDPAFFGMQITEPTQYASLAQPFEDLEKDISRGRKSMADLDTAIETWRTSGGEELRAFYTDILDAQ
ncbi:extracellular solute-binding protein [Occultella aeris]|uniref:Bacterial extracellular solute-binding protein n=1 Tax=Occultella aeris TaxID=2761496 RepID=A0A7M4DMP8_9MICO|nr:extracellular solute-binding protein [Occultella aeris]VZO38693.1 Bacterial extracellular solute-binding protein [Occultella aeris]